MTYKAIVIDDEQKLREVLCIKLKNKCTDVEVVATANCIETGYEQIMLQKPDIVFLDISMPGGTGFDLMDKFDQVDFKLIFVTGHSDYAIQALRLSAVDYLLKPVRTDLLVEAVEKAKKQIEEHSQSERHEVLRHNMAQDGPQHSKIAIPSESSYQFVEVALIVRCEGWEKYTRVHLTDGSCIVSSYNIGVYRDLLEPHSFYSCHKSHVINEQHISKYSKEGMITMSDGSAVPVSRRKKEEFTDRFIKRLG